VEALRNPPIDLPIERSGGLRKAFAHPTSIESDQRSAKPTSPPAEKRSLTANRFHPGDYTLRAF